MIELEELLDLEPLDPGETRNKSWRFIVESQDFDLFKGLLDDNCIEYKAEHYIHKYLNDSTSVHAISKLNAELLYEDEQEVDLCREGLPNDDFFAVKRQPGFDNLMKQREDILSKFKYVDIVFDEYKDLEKFCLQAQFSKNHKIKSAFRYYKNRIFRNMLSDDYTLYLRMELLDKKTEYIKSEIISFEAFNMLYAFSHFAQPIKLFISPTCDFFVSSKEKCIWHKNEIRFRAHSQDYSTRKIVSYLKDLKWEVMFEVIVYNAIYGYLYQENNEVKLDDLFEGIKKDYNYQHGITNIIPSRYKKDKFDERLHFVFDDKSSTFWEYITERYIGENKKFTKIKHLVDKTHELEGEKINYTIKGNEFTPSRNYKVVNIDSIILVAKAVEMDPNELSYVIDEWCDGELFYIQDQYEKYVIEHENKDIEI